MDRTLSLLLLCALFIASGCSTNRRQSDILEARLREQERALIQSRQELEQTRQQLNAAQREATQVYEQVSAGSAPLVVEQNRQLASVEKITLNKMLTGGRDQNQIPGDELLTVNILPVDASGNVMKLPGDIEIEVLDLNLPETNRAIGKWKLTSQEAMEYWHQGLVSSGYLLQLPWQQQPQNSKLVVQAKMISIDGRQFMASEQVQIRPEGSALAKSGTWTPLDSVTQQVSDVQNQIQATTNNWTKSIDQQNNQYLEQYNELQQQQNSHLNQISNQRQAVTTTISDQKQQYLNQYNQLQEQSQSTLEEWNQQQEGVLNQFDSTKQQAIDDYQGIKQSVIDSGSEWSTKAEETQSQTLNDIQQIHHESLKIGAAIQDEADSADDSLTSQLTIFRTSPESTDPNWTTYDTSIPTEIPSEWNRTASQIVFKPTELKATVTGTNVNDSPAIAIVPRETNSSETEEAVQVIQTVSETVSEEKPHKIQIISRQQMMP